MLEMGDAILEIFKETLTEIVHPNTSSSDRIFLRLSISMLLPFFIP